MAVVVKVAHDGRGEAIVGESLDDLGNRRSSCVIVYGDTYHLAPSARQMRYLCRSASSVSGVGVRHRLHDNRVSRSNHHTANRDARR